MHHRYLYYGIGNPGSTTRGGKHRIERKINQKQKYPRPNPVDQKYTIYATNNNANNMAMFIYTTFR